MRIEILKLMKVLNLDYLDTEAQDPPTNTRNISMDIHIWPTYLKFFCPNFFFRKSLDQKYPTYLQFGHMSKIS